MWLHPDTPPETARTIWLLVEWYDETYIEKGKCLNFGDGERSWRDVNSDGLLGKVIGWRPLKKK